MDAAQRRHLEELRQTFSHAQAVYDEYSARRPRIPAEEVDTPPQPPELGATHVPADDRVISD